MCHLALDAERFRVREPAFSLQRPVHEIDNRNGHRRGLVRLGTRLLNHRIPSHGYLSIGGAASFACCTAPCASLVATAALSRGTWSAIGSGLPCKDRNSNMRYSPWNRNITPINLNVLPMELVRLNLSGAMPMLPSPDTMADDPPLRSDFNIPNSQSLQL